MAGVVFDVAIVGFGPSGAVAAALLGQAGHRVYVCDRSTEVYAKPRAIALDHHFERLETAERGLHGGGAHALLERLLFQFGDEV